VNQYFAPTNESAQAVRDFLQAHGVEVSQLSPAGDWLGFNTTVAQANNMFDADYSVFRHLDSGSDSTNTLSYALPAAIKPHLSFVHPGIS
jgi:tripeptidyl-peptidase-1